ncbi:hypothetical protein HG531_013949 [Fusarium graminearum]|nr:hypothetical protein HG531_013949 [Fusarium graminearum]
MHWYQASSHLRRRSWQYLSSVYMPISLRKSRTSIRVSSPLEQTALDFGPSNNPFCIKSAAGETTLDGRLAYSILLGEQINWELSLPVAAEAPIIGPSIFKISQQVCNLVRTDITSQELSDSFPSKFRVRLDSINAAKNIFDLGGRPDMASVLWEGIDVPYGDGLLLCTLIVQQWKFTS